MTPAYLRGAGVPQDASVKAGQGLEAVMDAVAKAREADPTIQFACEQPGYSEMRKHPRVIEEWGPGILVRACAYGERQSGKTYRLWMNPATAAEFTPIQPDSDQSQCTWCKQGKGHPEAFCPKKGQDKRRVRLPGYTTGAARNRVPPALAAAVAVAQKAAREKMTNLMGITV